MTVRAPTNDEIYAAAGLKTAHGYPLSDADPRHDPHCEWHWCNRCNCSQALKRDAIVHYVVARFRAALGPTGSGAGPQ